MSKDTEMDDHRANAFNLWWKVTRRTQVQVKIIPRNYKLSTDSTELSAGQLYVSLLNKVLSINEKQFCGHEGKGVYPLTCDSVHSSISQVRSFRGHDPPWCWVALAGYKHCQSQSTGTCYSGICQSSLHHRTRPRPDEEDTLFHHDWQDCGCCPAPAPDLSAWNTR